MTGNDTSQSAIGNRKSEMIRVRVLFFGAAREAAGHDEVELELGAPCNAAAAFERVLAEYSGLRRFGRSLLFAVNQEYAGADREVREGDELAIFPPVSGGSTAPDATEAPREARREQTGEKEKRGKGERNSSLNDPAGARETLPRDSELPNDFFELTTEPIDVGAVA